MRYASALATLPLAFAAPLNERDGQTGANKYIVVLKAGAQAPIPHNLASSASAAGSAIASVPKDHIYDNGNFKGFAATLSSAQVAAIEKDASVSLEGDFLNVPH
jgi:hypothetical protein